MDGQKQVRVHAASRNSGHPRGAHNVRLTFPRSTAMIPKIRVTNLMNATGYCSKSHAKPPSVLAELGLS
jgi:hypothetical protein